MTDKKEKPVLEIRQFSKTYAKFKAVDTLSLTLYEGESVAFIGPNGAGKSTTMRAIAGLSSIETGAISILGHDVVKAPVQARQQLGYVSQDIELYRYLSGEEFLTFIAKIRGLEAESIPERVESMLQLCDLLPSRRKLIREYSGGMARKMAMAAALIAEPKLIVLDESFVGLDPESCFKLGQALKRACQNGACLLLSSHILDMLEELCTRFVFLHKGKLVADYSYAQIQSMKAEKGYNLTGIYLSLTEQDALIQDLVKIHN